MKKTNNIENVTLFKTPEESPGYLLWRITCLWRSFIEDALKILNLTHPQFVVLATIAWLTRNGDHITQIDISKATGLDPNTISQILKSLEIKKFIKRTRSLNERSKNPVLTSIGSNLLSKALPAVENSDLKFFDILTTKELTELIEIFQKLIRSEDNFK